MLRWSLDNPNAAMEREAYEFYGIEVPAKMLPPEFLPGVAIWYEAFWELSTDRHIGFGVGPIPHRSIKDYARGWPDADMFAACMRAMDGVYLQHQAAKSDQGQKLGPS